MAVVEEKPKTKTVKLSSSDEQVFEVDLEIAKCSITIKNILEGTKRILFLSMRPTEHSFADIGETETPIPLTNVTGALLKKILEYCQYHREHPLDAPADGAKEERRLDDIIPWDQAFCNVDQPTLFGLILAANYLDIKPLLDLTCKTVALLIKGKTPEEIRKTFS